MCWQSISLKDTTGLVLFFFLLVILFFIFYLMEVSFIFLCFTSQELLEGVVQERNLRFNPSRNATIFRHPTLGDFELQHVCVTLFLIILSLITSLCKVN